MNNKNQNQEISPDYNFILNQGNEPPGSIQPPKKKLSKKVIVLVVLVILLIPIFLVSVFFAANQNVRNNTIADNGSSAQSNATTPSIVEQYVDYVKVSQYESAYGLLSIEDKPSPQLFTDLWEKYYKATYDIASCRIQGAVQYEANVKTTVTCPALSAMEEEMEFIYVTSSPQDEIIAIEGPLQNES